jgi:phosphoribosylamine--glycine ligase/phosphoribosylformylglycinamidine cyclo-ligase
MLSLRCRNLGLEGSLRILTFRERIWMNILLVGSGAREHALAWKIASSPKLGELFCAPGNAGTAAIGTNVPIAAEDVDGLAAFASAKGVDLVVAGPEISLSLGLADALAARGIKCFGPTSSAARLESSKAFAKGFMAHNGIPTARYETFSDFEKAAAFVRNPPWPFVIKASGLASGKGVFLPDSVEEALGILKALLVNKSLGESGSKVVVEERLDGEEVSILGFCDGVTVRAMPPAQDHKRLLEGDEGPNTGGMGALASALSGPMEKALTLSRIFLEPACAALAAEGIPFVGILYAGIILTREGPKALEYNCRFGDPEAQAILPLLESDLLDIMMACASGTLCDIKIKWKNKASACVVLASEGYAIESGDPLPRTLLDFGDVSGSVLFLGSARREGEALVAQGGRLACAAAWDEDLDEAVNRAYGRLARLRAERTRFRRDIGASRNFVKSGMLVAEPGTGSAAAYAAAGVDIDAGDKAVELMSAAVKSTYGPEVLGGIGAFGGMYDASAIARMQSPVLVASTDGVGTKVKLAARAGVYDSIGRDIVNHCIDDILVQGAKPLFFLDYVATSKLSPAMIAQVVGGMAAACREAGCALIGGETAEMPGVYMPGEFDIAGAIVGIAEKHLMLPRGDMKPGDLLLGFPSSGPHTNGYSLIRSIFSDSELDGYSEVLGKPLIEILLEPHRSYLPMLWPILSEKPGVVKALAHITGGGFEGNVPRVLSPNVDAHINADAWPVPPLFSLIGQKGEIPREEMYRVFNMGMGMVAVVAANDADEVMRRTEGRCRKIGELKAGSGQAIVHFGAQGK